MKRQFSQELLEELFPDEFEAIEFFYHPVRAADLSYTRSRHVFDYHWNGFKDRVRSHVIDSLHMKDLRLANLYLNIFVDCVERIRYAERKQHINIISRSKPDGTLHVSGSYFRLLEE